MGPPEQEEQRGLLEAGAVVAIGAGVVLANCLVIGALACAPYAAPPHSLDLYVLSVAVADLLAGLCIVPLSVYPALVHKWVYGDLACRLMGFLGLSLWAVCALTFMWMGVDRYLAVRKPLRHAALQTPARRRCWAALTWLTSLSLCSPPLLGDSAAAYHPAAGVCLLDLGRTLPYSATLAALVLAPSLLTLAYTQARVVAELWRAWRRREGPDPDPDGAIALVLASLFWLSWAPWLGLRLWEARQAPAPRALHFWLFWLGVADCGYKFFVYLAMSPRFRRNLGRLCCCSRGSSGGGPEQQPQPLVV